ncbi:type VII secretion protein EsaA [Cytobacillus purgationiresistens]|uniref:Type VII secretion EsaA-like protein n=1 Tax=Cytobacillus purgationiresistens TaxID=863449 RepID=A0ABU0APU4_9BACI|nr:type VII secretion protein EsaA [Cytobacillus purgationiresistens]MDQ0273311.1 type VII secretion EsaA-like protein [Cytobacillus purgationiresistens]
MTEKTKYIIKMIVVMILVLGTPTLFFSSIGDNPLLVRSSETRNIAVVNEDTGAEKSEKELAFGKEVTSILSDESSYEWTVLSRSAAVNGLKNKKFDAIIYIPSDFSKSIMTYEDLQPVKAQFGFTVQDQLNAINREKVLREIENATAKVNGKVSTLYWSYVSQDLEGVRSKFDGILEKEIDFQNTMYAFYSPSSQSLANEIEQQKNMLEGVQTAMKSNEEFGENSAENVKQFEQSLNSFVEYVEQYKEYQDNQQQLLQKMQDESMLAVNDAINQQNPRYMELRAYLREQSDELSKSMSMLGTQLANNNQSMAELTAVRIEQVAKQRDALIDSRRQSDRETQRGYVSNIVQLKDQLAVVNPEPPEEPVGDVFANNAPVINEPPAEGGTDPGQGLSLKAEREKLLGIIKEIGDVSNNIGGVNEPEIAELSAAISRLAELSGEIGDVETSLGIIQNQDNPLQGVVNQLQSEIASLQGLVEEKQEEILGLKEHYEKIYQDLFDNRFEPIMAEIEKKEAQILNSNLLGPNQSRMLRAAFGKPILNKQPDLIMNYHSKMINFETALNNSLNVDANLEAFVASLNPILGIKEEEQAILDELLLEMPEAESKMTALQEENASFFDKYNKNVESQQNAINDELNAISESAGLVREKMHSLAGEAPVQAGEGANGTMLVTNQQSISQGMQTMNDSINSLGENHNNVVTYTEELQTKVQSVQQDADHLNDKWAENVSTTEMYRNDIFSVLGNTFVDGQKNGHVYDYLSNPLQVNGQVAAQQEDKKLPPVVVLVIVLISSLLIGYFSYYFSNTALLVKGAMFILLNLVVGLVISIYGLDIYPLGEQSAIEWTIFTILLLTAASAVVTVGFSVGRLVGWFASVGLVIFFISPLLALTVPNIDYEDPMSKVYMSIQYGPNSLFIPAIMTMLVIILVLAFVPYVISLIKKRSDRNEDEEHYEAS